MEDLVRIALLDDHRLFRSGIAALVGEFDGYTILFEAGDGEDMIRKINPKQKPHIILLDISMPKMNGIVTARWLRENHPDINIVILSMFEDAEKVLTMVRMGVKGYLLKDAEPKEFKEALRRAAKGEIYYPEFVTRHLVDSINIDYNLVKLNSREIEFLKLAATELTYKEIADNMSISSRTVDGYRDQLFDKLQIKSRIGLVLYAIKHKLIDL